MLEKAIDLLKDKTQFLELVYKDFAQPGVKKAGLALENVLSLTSGATFGFREWSEKRQLTFQKNMENYRKQLENVAEDKIVTVPTEIGVPILEKFTYVTNGEISKLFANLLAKASVTDTASLGHPGFVKMVENLSVDEAKILKHLSTLNTRGFIPFITYTLNFNNSNNQNGYIEIYRHRTGIELDIDLFFTNNIGLYFDNLTSLGILICKEDGVITPERMYTDLQARYAHLASEIQSEYIDTGRFKFMNIQRGHYLLIDYGYKFIEACSSNI